MKISSAFCDLHPLYELKPAIIKDRSPSGDINLMRTARCCSHPACRRHYTRDFGYVDFVIGQHPDLGDMSRKPRCGQNHEVEYMIVTKTDGVLTWACPNDQCGATQPYNEAQY